MHKGRKRIEFIELSGHSGQPAVSGVDDGKLKKIKELGLSCLEINLSDIQRDLSRENLEKVVADETTHKRWLHNVRADEKLKKMLSARNRNTLTGERDSPVSVLGFPENQ